ncbi:MAG: leucine-rich repeat protein, partial [Clostridia bacterium]|nr:leucine-rich repeat protein [Clostridia bacterium]
MYGKKILSLALTLMLLTGSINGYAASDDPVSDTETEFSDEYSVSLASSGGNDNESVEKPNPGQGHGSDKKDITGVLESGNISWSLSNAGMLTLSGNGAMDSFGETLAPWSEYKQSVKFIYVSDGITTIGDYAFYDLGDVKSVYIPESVEAIGSSAFEKCGKLKEISLSKGLKTIGEAAFKYCSELKDVNIPKNVEAISATAFSNCDKLRDINVDKHNNNYSSVDGVLFNTDATVLVSYPDGKKETDYTVPQGVTAIGEYAFDDCEKLSDVVLPNTLTTIGGNAFYGCSGIEKINIPASVTDIAHSAFLYECSSLKEINVDENNIVYSSELGVLFDKDKTKLIRFPAQCEAAVDEGMYVAPKTLKIIGQEAFLDCRTIELLWIHGSLEKIEMAAFMNLDSLMEIWFDGTIYNWELVEKDILNDKLNEIPVSCMEGELEKEFQAKVGVTYYLEDFVDLKDNEALLESLVVSSSNPDVAVVDNEKMTAISEGEAIITAIVNDAGITYAAAVKVIVTQDGSNDKSGAFELVEGETMDLKKALSVPDEFLNSLVWNSSNQGVATVDNGVVNAVDAGSAVVIATVNSESTLSYSIRCTITVEPKYTNEEYFEFNNGTITKYIGSDTEVDIPLTIGGIEVTAIGENAFKYCNHVTKVELPQTVTSIGNGAFSYCSSLSNISLHEGITYIGNYA